MLCRTERTISRNDSLQVGLARDKLTCLKIDTCDTVNVRFEMAHAVDDAKTFSKALILDMSRFNYGKHYAKTIYRAEDLEKDGFIQSDGSLSLRFFVKKNRFQERALAAEARVKQLEEQQR